MLGSLYSFFVIVELNIFAWYMLSASPMPAKVFMKVRSVGSKYSIQVCFCYIEGGNIFSCSVNSCEFYCIML
jgi:hypothetical protein